MTEVWLVVISVFFGVAVIALMRMTSALANGVVFICSLALIIGLFRVASRMFEKIGQQATDATPRIRKAPGSDLLVMVEYLYSPKIVEQVFKPIVADWRTEYFDALKEGKNRKAVWIRIRYILSFSMAMGLSKALSVIRSLAHR
jgi:uncharacterized membrane protein